MIKKVSESYKHNLFNFIFGPLLKMVEAFFDLLIPLFMKAIIDLAKYNDVSSIPESNKISKVLGGFIRSFGTWIPSNQVLNDAVIGFVIILSMGIIGFAVTMITQYIAAKTAMDVGSEVRSSLLEKTLSLSKKDVEKVGRNKLLTIVNSDSYQIQQGVLIFIRLIVRAPFVILGALTISLLLNWQIGVVFAAIIPLILFIVFFIMNKSSKEYIAIQAKLDNISLKSDDTLEGAKVIRAFNKEETEDKQFKDISNKYKKAAIHVNKLNSLINPLTFAIISIATILVVVIGGNPIFSAASNEGVLIASTIITEVAYLSQIFVTLVQLTGVVLILTKARVSRIRADEILAIDVSIKDDISGIEKNINMDEELINFHHVYLAYENDANYALQDIDFSLNKGQTLGIIGGTGSGKSSITSLLERYIDPSKGDITYKGGNIKNYKLSSLRKEIGLVAQNASLIKGDIALNLAMSNNEYNTDKMTVALKDAGAYEFVSRYDDFLHHEVEENGHNFSGGQRQRLTIARALYKNPEILILDDSTSALDLLTEKKVRENIKQNYPYLTKIFISQRISTVMDADLILVLDEGKIIAKGTHESLLNDCDIYKEIYETQVQAVE